MAVYLISYDIAEQDAFEYDQLWAELKRIRAVRILYSEWVMAHASTDCNDIHRVISRTIQNKDKLLVVELSKYTTWNKLLITDEAFQTIMANAR